ncbi:MAG: DUF2461 domain-containing protein [Bacteroidota bacterium]
MSSATIDVSTLAFLKTLRDNNHKKWFDENKPTYQTAHQNVISFADALIAEMNKNDQIETPSGKKSLLRIYRDVRFSKDKTPYKINFSGGLRRATKQLRGGYYFHIQPEGSFIAGGFWAPSTQDLKHIREQIAQDDEHLRGVISDNKFKKYFGELRGEQVKTAPKGFSKEHPAIDLLRYKSFILKHDFTDDEVMNKDFLKNVVQGFQNMRPFFDYMSEILTTDLNGVPIDEILDIRS